MKFDSSTTSALTRHNSGRNCQCAALFLFNTNSMYVDRNVIHSNFMELLFTAVSCALNEACYQSRLPAVLFLLTCQCQPRPCLDMGCVIVFNLMSYQLCNCFMWPKLQFICDTLCQNIFEGTVAVGKVFVLLGSVTVSSAWLYSPLCSSPLTSGSSSRFPGTGRPLLL